MKQLFVTLTLFALIACSKSDDPQPQQQTFDTIVGSWEFSGKDVSGSFAIAEFFGELVVDNTGSFSVKGVQYSIGQKGKLNIGSLPGTLKSMFLIHDDETYFAFHNLDINSSFTEIKVEQFSYGTAVTFVLGDYPLILKRK